MNVEFPAEALGPPFNNNNKGKKVPLNWLRVSISCE
jgi:hypothetical protein